MKCCHMSPTQTMMMDMAMMTMLVTPPSSSSSLPCYERLTGNKRCEHIWHATRETTCTHRPSLPLPAPACQKRSLLGTPPPTTSPNIGNQNSSWMLQRSCDRIPIPRPPTTKAPCHPTYASNLNLRPNPKSSPRKRGEREKRETPGQSRRKFTNPMNS